MNDPPRAVPRAPGRARHGRRVLAVLLAWALLEGAALLALHALAQRGTTYAPRPVALSPRHVEILERMLAGKSRYTALSGTLGWTILPNGHAPRYDANARGVRGARDFTTTLPPDRLRLLTFGDSFTHGATVGNGQTWQDAMEAANRRLEVLNWGVNTYGLDQAYLRFVHEAADVEADVVLIGLMSENVNRHVNTFRPFYYPECGTPLGKPRFVLEDERLVLVPNPLATRADYEALLADPAAVLPRIGARDHFYRARPPAGAADVLPSVRLGKLAWWRPRPSPAAGDYDPASEAYRVTLALLRAFADDAQARRARPVVVLFPNEVDIERQRAVGRSRYDSLESELRALEIATVDVLDAFERLGPQRPLGALVRGHYTAAGNRLVAAHLLAWLDEHGLADVSARAQ